MWEVVHGPGTRLAKGCFAINKMIVTLDPCIFLKLCPEPSFLDWMQGRYVGRAGIGIGLFQCCATVLQRFKAVLRNATQCAAQHRNYCEPPLNHFIGGHKL